MKKRFSKNRLLKVLETKCAQCKLHFKYITGETLDKSTSAIRAEEYGVEAVRVHSHYNAYLFVIYFIKKWDMQSEFFLYPETVVDKEDE